MLSAVTRYYLITFYIFFFPRMKIFVQVGMPHTAALCQTWPSPLCPYFLPCPQLTVSSGTLWRLHPKWVSSVFSFQLLTGSRCRFDDWRERDISSSDAFCSSGSHQKRKSLLCPASHEHRIESVCVCVCIWHLVFWSVAQLRKWCIEHEVVMRLACLSSVFCVCSR